MTDPTPTPTAIPDPARAALADGCRAQIVEAAAAFLSEVHDVDLHHYSDVGFAWAAAGEDPAELALSLTDTVQAVAQRAAREIRAAAARRAWLLSGAPLRCALCGQDVDPEVEPWWVCVGLAEHDDCHRDDDPAAEVNDRAQTRDEDEYQAHLDERNRTGPQPGDRVRLTGGDGSTVEGTWTVDDSTGAAVRRDDGTFHRNVTGQVAREVVELADDLIELDETGDDHDGHARSDREVGR